MNDRLLPASLFAAVVLAWAQLAWWQARSPVRARAWRMAALVAIQPVLAGLLYLTLVPPPAPGSSGTLTVATAGASGIATAGIIVALPEAPTIPGAEPAPDFATALRRHPAARVRVIGGGLEARDRDAARGVAIVFDRPPAPRGIIRLDPPQSTAPGGAFVVTGQVAGVPGGYVDLIDPAGTRVGRQPLGVQGDFRVVGTARVAGVALVRLAIRDAHGTMVEQADVPIRTRDDAQPRLLLLAGAASPDVKYLRRWATDAGLGVTTRITAGGGMVLGDAPVAIDAATLARFDVVVVDERGWSGLGAGARGALVAAVRGGMGLVVRLDGSVPDGVRAQWRALGLATGSAATTAPVMLDGDASTLVRRVVAPAPDAVAVWRDKRGAVLADWRAVGRGRVALWTVDQAFALVLTGQAQRYAEAWGTVLSAVARARAGSQATIEAWPRAGERMTLCAIGAGARIVTPGDTATLAIDPARAGCAGYWPRRGGWHSLADRGEMQAFYIYPRDALPGLRAQGRADATADLRPGPPGVGAHTPTERGASWPWFLAFLAMAGVAWWFERARFGRRTVSPQSGAISADAR